MTDYRNLAKEAASLVLDFVPVVGTGKSVLECVEGKDIITGEHINRWFALGGIVLSLIPAGKVLGKGIKAGVKNLQRSREAAKVAEHIAYGGSKAEVLERLEKVVPKMKKELDETFILEEFRKVDLSKLEQKMGVHFDPFSPRSDHQLASQLLVQLKTAGGHALHKHWLVKTKYIEEIVHEGGGLSKKLVEASEKKFFGGKVSFNQLTQQEQHSLQVSAKKQFLSELSVKEQKKITQATSDAEELRRYIETVLKDPKTKKEVLARGNIAYVNESKKAVIIYDPKHEGTMYYNTKPLEWLEKQLKSK